jgi:hypothetical protein
MSVIVNPSPGGGGGTAIGSPVISGTPGSVLFIDNSTNLAQDNANFFWKDSSALLDIGGAHPGGLQVFNTATTGGAAGMPIGLLLALTYPAGASESALFDWNTTPNVLTIGTEASGGGTVRDIQFIGGTVTFKAASIVEIGSTVGGLPAAGAAGRRAFVTDATLTTFGTVVAGTGANKVPVYDDGTNWRIG